MRSLPYQCFYFLQYTESYPSTPYLVQAYAPNRPGLAPNYTAALANEGFDNSTKTFPIRLNETIDFVFLNEASYVGSLEAHPWHCEYWTNYLGPLEVSHSPRLLL